jgi:molybdate transport system substrate-binding protein
MLNRLRITGLVALLSALALSAAPLQAQEGERLLVFGAASLTDALTEIGAAFESETGRDVAFAFAGSMTLARQIEASSGADLYISADTESMDYLDSRGFIDRATRVDLLANALVLIAPANAPVTLEIEPGFALSEALEGGRLALANTRTVPAGRYARAALESLAVWDGVAVMLAEAEDVRGALAFVARGEAPLGIVYATDAAIEPRVTVVGRFPETSHPPILYPAALTSEARPGAKEFLDFLRRDTARQVFEAAGFGVLAP